MHRHHIELAAELSASFASIYRHCHPVYTTTLGHQSVRALQLVSEDGATVQSIARHLGCAPNTASELVRRLVEIDLVTKRRGEGGDERSVTVCLTAKGQRTLLEHTGLDVKRLSYCLEFLSDDERIKVQRAFYILLNCVRSA